MSAERSVRELITPYTAGLRRKIAVMSVTAIVGGFAEALMLLIIARIAFALTSDHSEVVLNYGPVHDVSVSVTSLLVLAGAMVAVRMALQFAQNVLAAQTTTSVVNRTRRRLVGLFLSVDWATQATQREGRLQELLTTYASASAASISSLVMAATSGLTLIGLLITALAVSPAASIGAAFAALLIGLVLRPLRAAVRRRSARVAESGLEFATGVTELSTALQEVRVFGVGDEVAGRLGAVSDEVMHRERRAAYLGGSIIILYQGIAMFLIVGALGIAYAVNFSSLAALGAVVLMMVRSLSYAQSVQASVQALQVQAPYLETLRAEEERFVGAALPTGGDAVDHIGEVGFERVSFEYAPGVPVLRDVSFRARRGEIIGIVGPSGAGKSTLVQILLRLRMPTEGSLLVDGRDARDLAFRSWYEHVSFVPQDANMRTGTVADNIRFFREDVDDSAIQRAAKLAHIHDDIMSWPLGYDTPVGPRGNQLSGGQRQRVSIARALVEEPDVVVLDEPTSALDVKSEALIRETMRELAPRTTVFVIAHRLSTLSICDRIMVIQGGELQGLDDPATLEATNPFYREALVHSGMR